MFIVHTISPCWHRIFLCFFGGILEVFLRKHQGFGICPAVPGEEGWPVAGDPEGSALHVPWHTSSDGEIGKQAMNASGCFRITSSTVHQPWGSRDHKKRLFACLLCHCCAIAIQKVKCRLQGRCRWIPFKRRRWLYTVHAAVAMMVACQSWTTLVVQHRRRVGKKEWGQGWNYKEQLNKDESVNQWKFLFRLKSLCHSVISHSRKPKNRRDSWVGFVASIERRPSCAWKRIFAASQGHKCYAAFAAPSGAFPSRPAARSNRSSLDV